MSAAVQLPVHWQACGTQPAANGIRRKADPQPVLKPAAAQPAIAPVISLGFYRKHTESLLRRYLYASMQVGRTPSILGDPVSRGWASSRTIRTFEDAVIFVLDIEKCLSALDPLDRQLIGRVVLQEYTQAETATMLGMAVRTISYKFPRALDRLTEKLLQARLLILPA